MSTSRRKVSKFVVHITDNRSGHRLPSSAMKDLIEAKMSAPAPDRLYDNNMRNKFILLDCFQGDHPIYTGYFKSAKYNHRPPLISKLTLEERENPKLMKRVRPKRLISGCYSAGMTSSSYSNRRVGNSYRSTCPLS